jgi:glyoxylase-like metal-dependent hydrolase (beta-lactamase superfamily II)
MIKIKKFTFNPFQVNTFILWDETKECAIIDPGCYEQYEKEQLLQFIDDERLKPVSLINTHSHIDHIIGNHFVAGKYGLKLATHEDGKRYVEHAGQSAHVYGFEGVTFIQPELFVKEGERVGFGNSSLAVIETPGHAEGSICLISEEQKFVIVGDVLFLQSIGRTDLPGGDFNLLLQNIKEKLFTLDDEYTVYCGHGPETKIGMEKVQNPFLQDL